MKERSDERDERASEPAAGGPEQGAAEAFIAPVLAAGNSAVNRFVVARQGAEGGAAPAAAPAAPAGPAPPAGAGQLIVDSAPTEAQLTADQFRAALAAAANGAVAAGLSASPWMLIPARAAIADRLGALEGMDAAALEDYVRRAVPGGAQATTASALAASAAGEVARAVAGFEADKTAKADPSDRGANPFEGVAALGAALFKRRGGGGDGGAPAARLDRSLGEGRPLDARIGGTMGGALGDDFSDVRLHTGSEAGAMSDAMGARAFTLGRDIVFGSGEYKPGTPVGDALIAHELAHVVQQRGAPPSEPLAKGSGGEAALEEDADRAAVGAVVALWTGLGSRSTAVAAAAMPRLRSGLQLQRCSKPAAPSPTPEIELTQEAVGKRIAEGMNATDLNQTADSGIHYAYNYKSRFPARFKEDYWKGYADDAFWDRKGNKHWVLKSGASASAAIKKWLKGLTIAECLVTVVALQTDALRASIGDAKFDQHFGGADGPGSEGPLTLMMGWDGSSVGKYVKQTDPAAKGEEGTPGKRPAKVGDRYYFYNHPKYLLKHPGGSWQGENSIYMGEVGGKQMWSGLGATHKTEDDLLVSMKAGYDLDRTPRDIEVLNQRHGNQASWPAIYKEAKDGGTEFPDKLGSKEEILTAPAYTIGDTTRKGGFKADAGRELDLKKVGGM